MKQRKLRNLFRDEREKLTEEDVFESSKFKSLLSNFVYFLTKTKKYIRIDIFNGEKNGSKDFSAGTDGKTIWCNYNNSIVKSFPTLALRTMSVMGTIFHEIGHLLYTDFKLKAEFMNELETNGVFNASYKNKVAMKEVYDYIKQYPALTIIFCRILGAINNIVEDIFIETKLSEENEGTVKNSLIMNRKKIVESCPSLKQQIEKGYMRESIIINLILTYASCGDINNWEGIENEYTDCIDGIKHIINRGINAETAQGRINASVDIFLGTWFLFKEEIDEAIEKAKQINKDNVSKGEADREPQILDAVLSEMLDKMEEETEKSSSENKNATQNSEHFKGKKPNPCNNRKNNSNSSSGKDKNNNNPSKNDGSSKEKASKKENQSKEISDSSENNDENASGETGKEATEELNEENSSNGSSEDGAGTEENSIKDAINETSDEDGSGNEQDNGNGNVSGTDEDSTDTSEEENSESSSKTEKKQDDSKEDAAGDGKTGEGNEESEENNEDSNSSDSYGSEESNNENENVENSSENHTENNNSMPNGDNNTSESEEENAINDEDSEDFFNDYDNSSIYETEDDEAGDHENSYQSDIQNSMQENPGRIKEHEGMAEEADGNGDIEESNYAHEQQTDGLLSKINELLDRETEDKVNEILMNETEREYKQEVNECDFNNIHKNINFNVVRHREVTQNDITLYEGMKRALTIANNLVKEMERILKNKEEHLEKDLFIGKKIGKTPYNPHGKIFTKKNVPGDSELAVALLIDQSGSMSGDRIDYARITSVILQHFCKSYNIPIHIAGHNASYSGTVRYDVYADFDDFDNNDKFRIMQIYSGGCNRDGAALQFCGEHLLKRPEEKKLLILISDGQPADYNYSGEIAKQDLKAIKRNLKNKGVELFAAAIGSDKEVIKEIYNDNFLDISELKNLPRNLVRLVENFMEL